MACRTVAALVDCATPDALGIVEELEVACAVFDADAATPRLANAAWRALLGTGDAAIAVSRAPAHVAELAVGPRYVAITVVAHGVGGAIAACADITDEVTARMLSVDAMALVWGGTAAGDADYFNVRWSAYGARSPAWQHAIHPDDLAKCTSGLAWAIRERGSTDLEARVRRADGVFRWHRVCFAGAASGARWLAAATDIDEARELRASLDELKGRVIAAKANAETASRLKDQFLAVVSHELRAPLTTLVLWEGILRDETAEPALRARALDAIHQSTLSQSRVVGDLLDVSRAIAGKLHIDLRSIDVSALVREAIDGNAVAAGARQITVELRDTVGGAEVQGDDGRLRQVLDNLLSNAVKFTEPGGRVTVTVLRRGGSIVIDIEDTGCGIEPSLLPRLFDPFSQGEDALTRGTGGLGLGLAIARQLTELHGGTVVAASDGPGRGATLTVTLPASTAPRSATPNRASGRVPGLQQTHVLVVDDDQRVRDALGILLDRAGAIVVTAESAEEARAELALTPPDVIVCDIAMPGEDGYRFIRSYRAAHGDIPAIALTAYATESDVDRALAAGFDRHLGKPIDFERLVETIGELCAARRAQHA